ncbi:hypothetical protein ACHMW5_24330 [Azospirillum melinis]|uniref:hypothetical protein n=1 Tax=Azospirillum melinis TaxID=328839 RepID=UPI0037567686
MTVNHSNLSAEDTAALRAIPLFAKLTDRAVSLLGGVAIVRPVSRGTTLFCRTRRPTVSSSCSTAG